MASQRNETRQQLLDTVLAQGMSSFQEWLIQQADGPNPVFQEGHLSANPITRYINQCLVDINSSTLLYEGMIYTVVGARPVPEPFKRFLQRFHAAFADMHVSSNVLVAWIDQGMPVPPLRQEHLDAVQNRHVEIGKALSQAIALVRLGFLDPKYPTEEECLGIALATYCSWSPTFVARTCLRLCYAALEDSNCATMERLLREQFGEELASR